MTWEFSGAAFRPLAFNKSSRCPQRCLADTAQHACAMLRQRIETSTDKVCTLGMSVSVSNLPISRRDGAAADVADIGAAASLVDVSRAEVRIAQPLRRRNAATQAARLSILYISDSLGSPTHPRGNLQLQPQPGRDAQVARRNGRSRRRGFDAFQPRRPLREHARQRAGGGQLRPPVRDPPIFRRRPFRLSLGLPEGGDRRARPARPPPAQLLARAARPARAAP